MLWQKLYPTYTYRYKITVEIDTPSGVKSGSSVIEVETVQFPSWLTLGGDSSRQKVAGEAVMIDMGEGQYIFALLDDDSEILASRIFLNSPFHSRSGPNDAKMLLNMAGVRKAVPLQYLPKIMHFKDPKDPKTVEVVYAIEPHHSTAVSGGVDFNVKDHFSEIFGPHVGLKASYIEITSEPVTRKIGRELPSFSNTTGFSGWYSNLSIDDPRRVKKSNFIKR